MAGPTLSYANLLATYSALTPSTEELAYPRANIFHRFKRRPWRSVYQTFVITAKNSKLNFNVGGAEKTAALTQGTYRAAELAAHIANTMNTAAAVTDITCAYSGGTWTIAKGAGTLQLLTATGTNKQASIYPALYMDCRTDRTGALTYSSFVTTVAKTTGGQIIITTANQNIYFNIGAGGLTSSLDVGIYSATSVCADIQQRMNNTAGTTDICCAYNASTKKFVFYKGAGTLNLTCTSTGSAAWDTLGFSTAANRSGALSYTGDYQRIHSEESVVIDMGAATSMDFFSVAGINLAAAATGGTYSLLLQANASDAWSSPSQSLSPTNYKLDQTGKNGWAYWKLGGAINYRYYRLLVINNDNTDGFISIGTLFGGVKRTLTNNFSFGAITKKFTITEKQMTDQGGVYGEKKASLFQMSMSWPGPPGALIRQTDKDWLDGMLDAVEDIDSFPILIDETGASAPAFLWAVFVSRPEFIERTPDVTGSRWESTLEVRESG